MALLLIYASHQPGPTRQLQLWGAHVWDLVGPSPSWRQSFLLPGQTKTFPYSHLPKRYLVDKEITGKKIKLKNYITIIRQSEIWLFKSGDGLG